MIKVFIGVMFLILVDNVMYFSVPAPVRQQNRWSLTPIVGGTILGIEYHFGNKLKEQSGDGVEP